MGPLKLRLGHPLRSFRLELGLEVEAGTTALVGPSGAGKSTVLRCVAGLLRPEHGFVSCDSEVWLDTDTGVGVPAEERRVGFVFQDYALFPHLTVEGNAAYGSDRRRAGELLERFGLARLRRVRPASLSGGERQRVALVRALAREPKVLLLDEPMAALDPHTRGAVREELRALLGELGLPTLLVTHDFEDAAGLADRVAVLVEGRIRQLGAPAELVSAPTDPFVARLAGANLLQGEAAPASGGLTQVRLSQGQLLLTTDPGNGAVTAIVYPWDVTIVRVEGRDSSLNHLRGEILSLVQLGNRVRVRLPALAAEITTASADRLSLAVGEEVVASFKATNVRLVTRSGV